MTKFRRTALFYLPLLFILWGTNPSFVHSEDEKKEDPKPPANEEKPAPPAEDDKPAPEKPKEDPKPDPDPEPKPKPEPKPDPKDEPAELPAEKPKPKDKGLQIADSLWPALPEGIKPGPGGTVYLPGNKVVVGTKPSVLSKLIGERPPEQQALFSHERPQFTTSIEPVYFGRFELSNAQYRRYLDDFVKEYDTGSGGLGTIDRIAARLWSVTDKERRNVKYRLWRQLYDENKQTIWDAFEKAGKLDQVIVRRPGGAVDEDATAKKIRHEPLPRGILLKYLSPMRPPTEWKGFQPPADELDHPIRGCTYNEFERFGVWSGMHIMTEYEYEYAARGPDGFMHPWGNGEFPLTSRKQDLIVNWGAKVTKRYEPNTVPCHGLPGGASWCGVYNLIGNVAEWTSSWFENYPGNSVPNGFLGRHLKVIRGGSGRDLETLVLRPSYRNFQGNDAKGPPYPRNGYPWVGTRMAAYIESGRDQLGPITRHVVRYKKVKEHQLDFEHFKGMVSNNWTEVGAEVTNHAYVLGPSASVVFIPTRSLLVPDRSLALKELWEKSPRVRKQSSFLKRSQSDDPMFILGVLHIDAPLTKVLVPEPVVHSTKKKKKKKRKTRRRRRTQGPATIMGTCKPGTYAMAFWHGKICLTTPSLSFVCFLPTYPGQKKGQQAQVVKLKKDDPRMGTTLEIDTDLDEGPLKFQVDLGGEKPDDAYRVSVDVLLQFETGALESAGNGIWLSNPRPEVEAPANGGGEKKDEGDAPKEEPKDEKGTEKKDEPKKDDAGK